MKAGSRHGGKKKKIFISGMENFTGTVRKRN